MAINNYRAVGGAGFPMFREGTRVWSSTSEIRDLMAAYAQSHGTIDPAAINVRNYTLVPDLYAHYFGTAPAPGQPIAPAPNAPVTLPNTSDSSAPLGWVVALALTVLAVASTRRRGSAQLTALWRHLRLLPVLPHAAKPATK